MANRGTAQRPNGSTQGKICQFKLVLLGESAVGKSSLVLRFVKGQFHEYQESTIGGKNICIQSLSFSTIFIKTQFISLNFLSLAIFVEIAVMSLLRKKLH